MPDRRTPMRLSRPDDATSHPDQPTTAATPLDERAPEPPSCPACPPWCEQRNALEHSGRWQFEPHPETPGIDASHICQGALIILHSADARRSFDVRVERCSSYLLPDGGPLQVEPDRVYIFLDQWSLEPTAAAALGRALLQASEVAA